MLERSPSSVRPAAVAGTFYPGEPDRLRRAVSELLGPEADSAHPAPKAVIVPHAGYIYSGEIAASGYRRLSADAAQVKRIVLMGPAHRVHVRGLAAPSVAAFATPLGRMAVDQEAIATLADLPQVVIDDDAHAFEHSLEVQLPFLQRLFPEAKIVPFAIGATTAAAVAQVIARLWGGAETRFVISSDLSHYESYAAAQAIDQATAALIERFAGERIGPDQACGCNAIAGMLARAKTAGLRIERLDLRNSGDTAGPRDRVVGYGAWALTPE
jgi:AmmeMemoRadiSam system protein B